MNDLKDYVQGLDPEVRKQYTTKVRKKELSHLEEGRIADYQRLVESTGIEPNNTSIQELESRLIIKDEWGKYENVCEATGVSGRRSELQEKQLFYLKNGEIELFAESVKRAKSAPTKEKIYQEKPMILAQELEFILHEEWEQYALIADAAKIKVEDSLIQNMQLRYLDAGDWETYRESHRFTSVKPVEGDIKNLERRSLVFGRWTQF